MRIACVYVPELALQAILRRDPERREDPMASSTAAPVALCDGPGERARVIACTENARQAGVRPGLTASQARTIATGYLGGDRLRVLATQPADTAATVAALADLGYAYAPRVESVGERIYFDIAELKQLFPQGERAIAQAIAAQAMRLGLAVQIGIASNKAVARVAAQAAECAVVPPGGERTFLHPLPLATLLAAGVPGVMTGPGTAPNKPPPARASLSSRGANGSRGGTAAELAEQFTRWGIQTLGALAGLPAAEVGLRLGQVGATIHAFACGTAQEPFAPQLPPDALEEGTEIDYPVAELEPLAFLLRGVFDRALGRLTCRGLACASVGLRLKLDPRGFDVRDVALSAPTREPGTLLELCRLDLARRPPPAPVIGISVLLLPARVRASQLDLFRPAGPAPEKLAATLSRLCALVGTENVGAPALCDTFREEAVGMRGFHSEAFTRGLSQKFGSDSLAPLAGRGAGKGAHDQRKARAPLPNPLPASGARASEGVGNELLTQDTRSRSAPATDAAPAGLSLGFRRFRPPQPLEVLMDRDGPTALRGQHVAARILIAAGPYRSSGAWWTEEAFSRDYWDVHASDGAVYRVHQDRVNGSWFLDGYYD